MIKSENRGEGVFVSLLGSFGSRLIGFTVEIYPLRGKAEPIDL